LGWPTPSKDGTTELIVLGIESSTAQTSAALGSEQEILASCVVSRGSTADEFMLPSVKFMLDAVGLTYDNVSGVAVGLGPGTFTSLRVGVSTAKTMAQALAAPIVGIPSLDILAYDVRYSNRVICPVLDAKRGEVFFAFYRQVPGGVTRTSDYMVGSIDRLQAEMQGQGSEVLLVGSGALLYRSSLDEIARVEFGSMANASPQATSLVELALPRLAREDYDSLFEIEPMYMRRSDAEIRWDRKKVG
jgi:tRNA threonylcarbamoyladenosine biosynthesis protein TsaB